MVSLTSRKHFILLQINIPLELLGHRKDEARWDRPMRDCPSFVVVVRELHSDGRWRSTAAVSLGRRADGGLVERGGVGIHCKDFLALRSKRQAGVRSGTSEHGAAGASCTCPLLHSPSEIGAPSHRPTLPPGSARYNLLAACIFWWCLQCQRPRTATRARRIA